MPAARGATPATLEIELQRRFRASPERVFRAWTRPSALREWWCPPGWIADDIELDVSVGGSYCIRMRRVGDSRRVAVRGRFLEVKPPERLVYTWCWEGAFADMPETLVTLELFGSETETLLTLRHEKFADLGLLQQHRAGWIAACNRLDRLVSEPGLLHDRPAAH
jgi:uncharacterized protein YndB with AHSA1/START domain